MPEEPAEIARRAYDAISSGDLDRFVALIDPDVEFRSLIAEAEGKVYRGHEGVREWWRDVAEALGGLDFRGEEFRPVGEDGVVVRVRVAGSVRDVPVEQTMWQAALTGDRGPYWWQTFRTEDEAMSEIERRQGRSK